MTRVATFILVLAALLVQLRTGALPADEMCLNFGPAQATCACCGKKAHADAVKACCRTDGCERCVRVPAPERQVAPQAKVRTARTIDLVGAALAVPVMVWRVEAPAVAWSRVALVDESPPDLARIRTTRLLV